MPELPLSTSAAAPVSAAGATSHGDTADPRNGQRGQQALTQIPDLI
ncbi:hypothetical protein ACTMTF_19715 [Nonomuraea sp. ZG12]